MSMSLPINLHSFAFALAVVVHVLAIHLADKGIGRVDTIEYWSGLVVRTTKWVVPFWPFLVVALVLVDLFYILTR